MNKKILFGVVGLLILVVGYILLSPIWRKTSLNETLPGIQAATSSQNLASVTTSTFLLKGSMQKSAHDVEGTASIVQSDGKTYLRFENLNTINGPDLRIYLSQARDNSDYIDLGSIRATQGNVNYQIPIGTDIAKYHYALIWCRTFHVLFSFADMEK